MNSRTGFNQLAALAIGLALMFQVNTAQAQLDCSCGDVNSSGNINIADMTYLVAYLFASGQPPTNFQSADMDRHQYLTVRDIADLMNCAPDDGGLARGINCETEPLNPPYIPPTLDSKRLVYPNHVPANTTSMTVPLTISNTSWDISGFTLPIAVSVNGIPTLIDSIVYDPDNSSGFVAKISRIEASKALLGGWLLWGGTVPRGVLATLYIATPDLPDPGELLISWTTLVPVNGPAEDSSLYPMVVGPVGVREAFVPVLVGSCCDNPGDVNDNGAINISDATYTIGYIFDDFPAHVCQDQMDANGSGTINISDATYIIGYIFSGGPAPICGSSGG